MSPHVIPAVGVIVAHIAHIVLDAVAAQRGVHVPAQPVGEVHTSQQLDTHAVALVHVLGHEFTDLVDLAVEHELVLVVHVVKVGTEQETARTELVTGFPVIEFFARGMLQEQAVGVVVARGLLLGHGKRGIDTVLGVDLPVETSLGVEEIKGLVDIEGLQTLGVGGPVPLVVVARDAVTDVAVLQVGIGAQAARDKVVTFYINVEIGLTAVVAVVLVVRVQRAGVVLDPDDLTVVVVAVAVDAAAQCGCQLFSAVLQ